MSETDWRLRNRVKGLYTCGICNKILVEARFLECHHSFCTACLDSYKSVEPGETVKIVCPTCLRDTELSCDDIRNILKPDGRANDVVKMLPATPNMSISDCQLCVSTTGILVGASIFCGNCNAALCSRCALVHRELPATSGHQVYSVQETSYSRGLESSFADNSLEPHEMNNNYQAVGHPAPGSGRDSDMRELMDSTEFSGKWDECKNITDKNGLNGKNPSSDIATVFGEREPMLKKTGIPYCRRCCCAIM